MARSSFFAGILVLVFGASGLAQQAAVAPGPAAKTSTTKPAAKRHKQKAPETPAAPAVEAPPPTPEESPAGTPDVTYQNGLLSIRSDNSTLSSILNAIKARTGATVDASGVSMADRIATQLGPGDPRDVLTSLLSNSKYDFILLGAPGNPTAVQRIVLAARVNSASQVATGPAGRQGPQQAVRVANEPPPQPDADQELPDAEIPDEANLPEQQQQPEPQNPQNPNMPSVPMDGDQAQQPNPNQPKSPEQLLQELQRMQQQQQQQMQQQQQQNLNPH